MPEIIITRLNGYDAQIPKPHKQAMLDAGLPQAEIANLNMRAYPMLEGEYPQKTDIYEKLLPFLEDLDSLAILTGALRTADLTIGCVPREGSPVCCDTCLADSPAYKRQVDKDSLIRLIEHPNFNQLLQSSFRLGSGADPLDHQDVVEIVGVLLKKAVIKKNGFFRRGANSRRCEKIKISTTYRPRIENRLLKLIELEKKSQRGIKLGVSMPFNVDRSVQKAFKASKNREIILPYIGNDVEYIATERFASKEGRSLHPRHLEERGASISYLLDSDDLGTGKLFVNPDGLWMMYYLTPGDSHTGRGFIHIDNPGMLKRLAASIPFNKDFDTPDNWPNKSGSLYPEVEAIELQDAYILAGEGNGRPSTTIEYF